MPKPTKLYYAPGACSLSPHIVACELGLDLAFEKVDLRSKQTAAGANYLAINPKGYVPALEFDDGSVLTEGPAIVQLLADLVPGRIAPLNGSFERYRLQEWLAFIGTELHKTVGVLFGPAVTDEVRQATVARFSMRLDYVAKVLADRSWLMGDDYSVADVYLYVILSWTPGLKVDLSNWPVLAQFLKRVAERPGVRAARQAEGLPV